MRKTARCSSSRRPPAAIATSISSRASANPAAAPASASSSLSAARTCSPPMVVSTACGAVIKDLLAGRGFEFDVERAIFATVLHRLFVSGSDRACDKWIEDYAVPAVDGLALHHLYRAMAWLGEELDAADDGQAHATPFAPRCVKDQIEEALFARRRDLFSELSVVFMDTTSLSF